MGHKPIYASPFLTLMVLSSTELQRIFPNIGEVFHAPVVGYWEAGQLKEMALGFAARQLVGRLFSFDRTPFWNKLPRLLDNSPMPRPDNRSPSAASRTRFHAWLHSHGSGSVLVKMGRTTVLCTCCVEPKVPDFLVGKGKGWLTAEYGMLPGSTEYRPEHRRDKAGKVDGRSVEIQRLIGRSLRGL